MLKNTAEVIKQRQYMEKNDREIVFQLATKLDSPFNKVNITE